MPCRARHAGLCVCVLVRAGAACRTVVRKAAHACTPARTVNAPYLLLCSRDTATATPKRTRFYCESPVVSAHAEAACGCGCASGGRKSFIPMVPLLFCSLSCHTENVYLSILFFLTVLMGSAGGCCAAPRRGAGPLDTDPLDHGRRPALGGLKTFFFSFLRCQADFDICGKQA